MRNKPSQAAVHRDPGRPGVDTRSRACLSDLGLRDRAEAAAVEVLDRLRDLLGSLFITKGP